MNRQTTTALRLSTAAGLIAMLLVCVSSRNTYGQSNPPAPTAQGTPEQKAKDAAQAEEEYRRAIANAEKAQGSDSPDVAKALVDLAMFYFEKQEAGKGVPLLERALAI